MNTEKPILKGFYKTLFSLAFPIILQNLMQTFVNMLDTIMVGRLGAVEIASVGLGNQIFFMLNMVIFGICSGGSIFISQFWGQNNIKGIRNTTGIMVLCSFGVSIIFMCGAIFIPNSLLKLYTNDIAVINEGVKYLSVIALSYPINAICFALQMSFRSTEHVYLPMTCTAVSLVSNAILNIILIFGLNLTISNVNVYIPAMDVKGAALATLISRVIELIIVLSYSLCKKFEVWGTIRDFFDFDTKFLKKIAIVCLPVIFSETCWGLGITIQNSIFAHSGTDAIAAFNITNTISQLTWVFFIGLGNAAAIILGKKIGAGDEIGAKAYVGRFSWFMPLLGGIIGLFLFPLSKLLPFIFNVDNHIIKIATSMIYVLICVYPLRAFNMLLIVGICRSGGDTIFGMLDDNGWMWLVAVPLGFLAAFYWNLNPWMIMMCLESEQLFKAIFGIMRIKSGKWLHNLTKVNYS